MKNFRQIITLISGYRARIVSNFVFNILNAIFSLFTFAAIVPFLNILFGGSSQTTAVSSGSSLNRLWVELSSDLRLYIDDHGQSYTLLLMCCGIVVLALMKNLVNYFSLLSIAHIRTAVSRDLRGKMYNKLLQLPLAFFSNERKGDILSRMTNDLMEIEFSVIGAMEALFKSPVLITLSLTTLFALSWKLTLFAFIFLPISGFLISRIAKSLKNAAKQGKGSLGDLISIAEETLSGIRILKVFNAEGQFSEKFSKTNEFNFRLMEKLYRREYLASPMSEFISLFVISILLFVGGRIVISGELSGELLIFYLVVFSQIIAPARAFSDAIFKINKGVASLERVNEILHAEETVSDIPDAVPLNSFTDRIEFRDLSFAYGEKEVLRNVSFTIQKGQTVALVGASGGGKSTVASLLARFYDPTAGAILIDGHPLNEYKLSTVRAHMGFVSQDSILFNDSVKNNIALGTATAHGYERAARIANAEEFILKLAGTYDFVIGEGGNRLSGGQKQRMAIARAIFKNPPILILDEATSALDTESEKLVQDAINKLMENRTSLVIAHRLSTIKRADLILVMQNGEICERGTHDQLMQQRGAYCRLVEMQQFD
jgi:ATP-binding cassette, subfamily B, bacterial MsbA